MVVVVVVIVVVVAAAVVVVATLKTVLVLEIFVISRLERGFMIEARLLKHPWRAKTSVRNSLILGSVTTNLIVFLWSKHISIPPKCFEASCL